MTIQKSQLVKNTSLLFLSQSLSWVLAFILTLFLPRYLGVENMGILHLGTSIWIVGNIIATFGMNTYLTREIAGQSKELGSLIVQSFVGRTILFIVFSIGLWIYLIYAGYSRVTVQVILIVGLSTFIGMFNGGFYAAIQGLERIGYLAVNDILLKVISTAASFAAIFMGAGVQTFAWITVGSNIVGFIILGFIITRLRPTREIRQVSVNSMKVLLGASLSFFLLQIFINLYQQVDVVIISLVVNEKGVGWYSVADRLVGTICFIPSVFVTVFFPTFSRLQVESPQALSKLMNKIFDFMVLLGISIGFGTFLISGAVIQLIYGPEFTNSTPILAVRGMSVVFTYLNSILGIYLISIRRQKAWIVVIALATLATIPLDLVFVPYFQNTFDNGALGGAFSYVLTEFSMVLAAISLTPKGTLTRANISYALRVITAGSLMVVGVRLLNPASLIFQVILGVVIFVVAAVLLRLISADEWHLIKTSASNLVNRIQKKAVHPVE